MNPKLKKLYKNFLKNISNLKVEPESKKLTLEIIRQNILGDLKTKGETKITFLLSEFKENKVMKYIMEHSNLKKFVEIIYLNDGEVDPTKALEEINNVQIDVTSFCDFIMTSILFRDFIVFSQEDKIKQMLKEEVWMNTPLSKYMLFLSINAFQNKDLKLERFFSSTPLILSNYTNISYWISEMLQFNNIHSNYHENLLGILDLISRSNLNDKGQFANESIILLIKMIVDSYIKNEPMNQPVYWIVQFIKEAISLGDLVIKLEGFFDYPKKENDYIDMNQDTAFIWGILINKIIIYNSELHRRAFLAIWILTYRDIGKFLFDARHINYIRESLYNSNYKVIFLQDILKILEEKQDKISKLEEVLWETTIAEIFVEEKSGREYLDFATNNKLSVSFLYIHMKKILSLRTDEKIKEYIAKARYLINDEPTNLISSLELAKINKSIFDLDEVQSILDNEDYYAQAPFISKVLFTRYMDLNFKDKEHKILKKYRKKIFENSVATIKRGDDQTKKSGIDNLSKTIFDLEAKMKKQRKANLNRWDGFRTSVLPHFLDGTVWTQMHKFKIIHSNTAQIIKPNSSYFLSLFDFVCSLKAKTKEEIQDLFKKIEHNNIKFYFYKSHIDDLTNDTISEGVINSDRKVRRLLNVEEKIRLFEKESSKIWENQVYWMFMENINKIFFLVQDAVLIFAKYSFLDDVSVVEKQVTTIPSSKISGNKLLLNVGKYEW